MMYSSIVSKDSVRIALTILALNDLEVLACDIQNAYLKADCRERVWTTSRTKFESKAGRPMLTIEALYGVKSSGAAFRAHLAETLDVMGYTLNKARWF
jgi:hypothetical protein